MTTVVLLGAGASVDAGLPSTAALTHEVVTSCIAERAAAPGRRDERLRAEWLELVTKAKAGDRVADHQAKEHRRRHPDRPIHPFQPPDALDVVYRRLRAHAAQRSNELHPVVDLEELVTTLEELAERETRGIGAFVHDWIPELLAVDHANLGLFTHVEVGEYDQRLVEFVQFLIERRLTGGKGSPFRGAANRVVVALRERLQQLDEDRVDYLLPLVRHAVRTGIPVFTLNHDLALEAASARAGVPWSHGLDGWEDNRSVEWPAGHAGIMKLHGSIDWSTGADGTRPFLFGGVNKLTVLGPYLDMLREFDLSLRQADGLLVVGYSFRDDHINGVISRFLVDRAKRNEATTVTIVDPGYGDDDELPRGVRPKDVGAVDVRIVREFAATAIATLLPGTTSGTDAP